MVQKDVGIWIEDFVKLMMRSEEVEEPSFIGLLTVVSMAVSGEMLHLVLTNGLM